MERHSEPEIRPRMGADRCPVHMTCQVTEDRPTPAIPSEMESGRDMIEGLLPTPTPPPLQAAPKIFRWRHSCTATDGNDLPTNTGGTGTTPQRTTWKRHHSIIQPVPSGNSHGEGHCPTRAGDKLHRGVFFMRGMDT